MENAAQCRSKALWPTSMELGVALAQTTQINQIKGKANFMAAFVATIAQIFKRNRFSRGNHCDSSPTFIIQGAGGGHKLEIIKSKKKRSKRSGWWFRPRPESITHWESQSHHYIIYVLTLKKTSLTPMSRSFGEFGTLFS